MGGMSFRNIDDAPGGTSTKPNLPHLAANAIGGYPPFIAPLYRPSLEI